MPPTFTRAQMRWLCAANPSRFACTNRALPRVADPPRAQNTNHDSRYATRADAERLRELSEEQEVAVHVRESGGHLGEGGRYRRFEQASLEVAWLERAVGR